MLLLVIALAACSNGPQADLPSIGEARSLGAEWALVNEQGEKGQVNQIYVDAMHKQLREQLRTDAKSLSRPDSAYGREIQILLKQPDNAPPEALRAHTARLKAIEDSLESA
jgi:hypothetical protein